MNLGNGLTLLGKCHAQIIFIQNFRLGKASIDALRILLDLLIVFIWLCKLHVIHIALLFAISTGILLVELPDQKCGRALFVLRKDYFLIFIKFLQFFCQLLLQRKRLNF